jgi:hypothetical protein
MITFGDNVRVRATPVTEAAGIAGRTGIVHGNTTPSITGIDVLGECSGDYAVHIYFEDLKRGHWLAPELVEFIDHNPGTGIRLHGIPVQWTRSADGEWHQSTRWLPPREWWAWIRRFFRPLW